MPGRSAPTLFATLTDWLVSAMSRYTTLSHRSTATYTVSLHVLTSSSITGRACFKSPVWDKEYLAHLEGADAQAVIPGQLVLFYITTGLQRCKQPEDIVFVQVQFFGEFGNPKVLLGYSLKRLQYVERVDNRLYGIILLVLFYLTICHLKAPADKNY